MNYATLGILALVSEALHCTLAVAAPRGVLEPQQSPFVRRPPCLLYKI